MPTPGHHIGRQRSGCNGTAAEEARRDGTLHWSLGLHSTRAGQGKAVLRRHLWIRIGWTEEGMMQMWWFKGSNNWRRSPGRIEAALLPALGDICLCSEPFARTAHRLGLVYSVTIQVHWLGLFAR